LKTLLTFTLALLTGIARPALAQGMSLKTSSGAEIGIQISSYKYEEDVNDAFFMSLEGAKIGLAGSVTRALEDDWYWGGDARFVTGNTNYRSAGSGEKTANPDSYLELRVIAGRDLEIGSQVLSPYAGLGYRYLNNDLRGYTDTGASGYRRVSSYTYVPMGVTHRFGVSPVARFATTFEYDYLLQGMQRSYLTDLTAAGFNTDLDNLQRNGHGLRLDLAYEMESWSAGVFYHYWDIAESEIGTFTKPGFVYSGVEPHNITREFGVLVKYRFQ